MLTVIEIISARVWRSVCLCPLVKERERKWAIYMVAPVKQS
jgi:hypothetical protein